MKRRPVTARRLTICVSAAALGFVLAAPATAWVGGCHFWASEAAANLYRMGFPDLLTIDRNRETPLYPELELYTEWYAPEYSCCDEDDLESRYNWDWFRECSRAMDDLDSTTLHHFWDAEEGLHGTLLNADNAWNSVRPYWWSALNLWNSGELGGAYAYLGYTSHFIQDMGQPAHANEDLHPQDDALEEWISQDYCSTTYQWVETSAGWRGGGVKTTGPILAVPTNNAVILNDMIRATGWAGHIEVLLDPVLMNPSFHYNIQQLFYIMYVENQIGGYFASDDEDGDTYEPIGWVSYAGFPTVLYEYGSPVPAQDRDALADNDANDSDFDGDLSTIAEWGYGGSFRAMPAVIELFRRTVDAVPPDTVVDMARADGLPVVEWNNSPVSIQLVDAVDYGNPGFRPSGVWTVWGLLDGEPPMDWDLRWWNITEDGIYELQCMSVDMIGNVDTKDLTVRVDLTPPEIAFPDLKPLYLTSEEFVATWVADDNLSGVKEETAYLDGQLVGHNEVIDLALMAGWHRLEVYVEDMAGNLAYAIFEFEVVIDAEGWCLPVRVNKKTSGNGMFCVVEFPTPYDVGLIDFTTATLESNGFALPAELITGVGDHDEDLNPDRMLRFDKEGFVTMIGGQTGSVPAEVWGGLFPAGLPRFVADVEVAVFTPGG